MINVRLRSDSAYRADLRAIDLITSHQLAIWVLLVILVLVEGAIYYFNIPSWIGIAFGLGWLGLVVHLNLMPIYSELLELNDQVAGRKEDLRQLIRPSSNSST
jgi:hypothetical protein